MLSAIRRRREAAPSWGKRVSAARWVGHGVALLDKRKEPDERCILDIRLACRKSDLDCRAIRLGSKFGCCSASHDVSCRFGCTPDSRLGRRPERTVGQVATDIPSLQDLAGHREHDTS